MGLLQLLVDSLDGFQRGPGVASLWIPISTPAAPAAHILAAGHVFASSRRLTVGTRELSLLELCLVVSSLQHAFLQLQRYPGDSKGVIRTLRPLCARRARDLSLPQPELKHLLELAAFLCSSALRDAAAAAGGADDIPEEDADLPGLLAAVEAQLGPLACAEGASLPSHVQVAQLTIATQLADLRAAELAEPLQMTAHVYTDVGALAGVLAGGLAAGLAGAAGAAAVPAAGLPSGERDALSAFYAGDAFLGYSPAVSGLITISGPVEYEEGGDGAATRTGRADWPGADRESLGGSEGASGRPLAHSVRRLPSRRLVERREAAVRDLAEMSAALHSVPAGGSSVPSSELIRCMQVPEARSGYFMLPELHPRMPLPEFQLQDAPPAPKSEAGRSQPHQGQQSQQNQRGARSRGIWYIILPAHYSSAAINEANALFFFCAGEYRNSSVLLSNPKYQYIEEQVAYARGLQERREVTALEVRGYQDEAFYCYRRGKKIKLVTASADITEEQWRDGCVAAIVLSGSASQLQNTPLGQGKSLSAALKGQNAVYFYDAASAEGVSKMEGVPCRKLAVGSDQGTNKRALAEFWDSVDRVLERGF